MSLTDEFSKLADSQHRPGVADRSSIAVSEVSPPNYTQATAGNAG